MTEGEKQDSVKGNLGYMAVQQSFCYLSLAIFLFGDANLDAGQVKSSRQNFDDDILVPHRSLLGKSQIDLQGVSW